MNLDNQLITELDNLLSDDYFEVSILANSSALINQYFNDVNWVGFYILMDDTLYLGPFQGKVACTTIKVGKGVCGTAVSTRGTIVVDDVHKFPGHIACDEASNSEIVIPIFLDNNVYGVLDIDSPLFNRFTNNDKLLLEQCVMIISKHLMKIKR